ncbi:uncharacterized protein LOC132707476 isoform X2 [Cylas formicarius]|uniref:uncharacterized protein LOC132707476 isoform X2 n=1 Tax=Cylas formicarius TaxID=197179 RepID=UPI002958C8D5|nr:uncharacterized protein LOC132707476 isoform X2 [Cylas formicarius]
MLGRIKDYCYFMAWFCILEHFRCNCVLWKCPVGAEICDAQGEQFDAKQNLYVLLCRNESRQHSPGLAKRLINIDIRNAKIFTIWTVESETAGRGGDLQAMVANFRNIFNGHASTKCMDDAYELMITIQPGSESDEFEFNSDESYSLVIHTDDRTEYVKIIITAPTIAGATYAMATLTELILTYQQNNQTCHAIIGDCRIIQTFGQQTQSFRDL